MTYLGIDLEWASDFCWLTSRERFVGYILAATSYIRWNDNVQHAEMDFYSAISRIQQSPSWYTCRPIRKHYRDSDLFAVSP